MTVHFIQHKGRGGWVLGMPLVVASILFIAVDVLGISNAPVRDLSLIFSGLILLLTDEKREIITEGVMQRKGTRPKGKHTFMWIEMRYWAIALCVIGFVFLILGQLP